MISLWVLHSPESLEMNKAIVDEEKVEDEYLGLGEFWFFLFEGLREKAKESQRVLKA